MVEPSEGQEKTLMTWNEFDDLCKILAKKVMQGTWSYLYGIPRGGLVVAVRLSHLTGLPVITNPVEKDQHHDEVLIVDDICDTGSAIKDFQTYAYDTACLMTRKTAWTKPTITAIEIESTDWVIFPWETTS